MATKQVDNDETQEQEAPERLIDENGVAVSPYDKYPGEVRFKLDKLGQRYLDIGAAVGPKVGDTEGDLYRLVPYLRALRQVADTDIDALREGEVADIPPYLMLWAKKLVIEYHENFLIDGG